MFVKLILPALLEAKDPGFRPIKYALFPPLGLAALAGCLDDENEVVLEDEPVMPLTITVFLGPGEDTWPRFLADFWRGEPLARYVSRERTLLGAPPLRRDLIDRRRYLCPNSLVVSRGCPHHCDFCYKDAFYQGGKSFYTRAVDEVLAEIERLPGRHLYFLDDHLLGNRRVAATLFAGMRGMGRVFQGASTVNALDSDLVEQAAEAGMRSVFVGLETLNPRTSGVTPSGRTWRATMTR